MKLKLSREVLSSFVGIGFIIVGAVYFVALFAVNRFERKLNQNPW